MAQGPNGIMQLAGTVRVGGTSIDRNVLSSIHAASRKTGVSFAFMLAKARRESNFETSAANGTSSAQGLYQFTTQTWLDQIKSHGAEHGLGDLADQIYRDKKGHYRVDDPEVAQEILDLRDDHGVSSAMAAEYAADNRRYLSHVLGRRISDTDLYFAHFLGPGGAAEFLKALEQDPNQDASAILPNAASANHSIFFGAGGKGRSLGEIHALVERNIKASVRRYASAGNLPEFNGPIPLPPGTKPDTINKSATLAAGPEDMGAAGNRRASLPLPPGTKPTQTPENMGTWRESGRQMASAEGLPRPIAQKPKAENMGGPRHRPTPAALPRTLVAEAEGTSQWSDQALAISLAQAAPSPAVTDPREQAFNAAQAFVQIAQAGYQWSRAEPSEEAEPIDSLLTPGLVQASVRQIPERHIPESQTPTTTLAGESGADSLTLHETVQTASATQGPKVTAASGAASYAVLAVVETFDPNKRITSFTSPLPDLKDQQPPTEAAETPDLESEPDDTQGNSYPMPMAAPANPVTVPSRDQMPSVTAQATVVGWFRRMLG
ncbi:hypothetical protein [Rhodospirillum sp. A1_3_36]|uniref:hypothetical protein n=1 Tax=Rhodospirillum sp. A1_3_36 TaxID=3391666 RepID=UPI0039A449B7